MIVIEPSCFSPNAKNSLRELCGRYINNGGIAAEVGTWEGGGAQLIASECMRKNARLICIDGFSGAPLQSGPVNVEFMNKTIDNLKGLPISFLPMDSLKAAGFIADNSLDLCFIDGGHISPVIDNDIDEYIKKVRTDGCLCGHDYSNHHMDVVRAVDLRFSGVFERDKELWWVHVTDELRGNR